MRPRLRTLISELVGEGALSTDDVVALRRALAAARDEFAPWYVRLLSAFGAWIAAGLIVWFLFAAGLFREGVPALVAGLVLLGGMCVARGRLRSTFLIQGALALAVAGEALALVGLADALRPGDEGLALITIALNAAVVVALADPVGRFLASAFAIACVVWLGHEHQGVVAQVIILGLAAAAFALWSAPVTLGGERWRAIRAPLGVALVAGFLGMMAVDLDRSPWRLAPEVPTGWVIAAGMIALGLAVVARLLREHAVSLRSEAALAAMAGVALLGAVGWRTPGVLGAALVLAIGYHRREVVLVGLAVAFFAGFAGWYYYSLDLTLLAKSAVLILSGGLALAARRYLRWRWTA